MSSSPGLVTVILFLLGKKNASKNLDPFFCYVNKTFKRNFIPEFYAQDHRELSYFPLGQTRGDSVSQMDGQVTLLEGATLTVNCTYSATGYLILFWYVQYPGEGNGNTLQYSYLENPMDGGAWQATVHGVSKSRPRLSDFTFSPVYMHRISVPVHQRVQFPNTDTFPVCLNFTETKPHCDFNISSC